jgi:hypothetical protein
MEEAGLEFRATKDLDVVLLIEALDRTFGETFWRFVADGGYRVRQSASRGVPERYRFRDPERDDFPSMVELFSRRPIADVPPSAGHLTLLPLDDDLSSLSAILLDDEYYAFVRDGSRERDGLRWVEADRLIPLKASAWLDLRDRKARGEAVDGKTIRKHAADIVRLSQLLRPDQRTPAVDRITEDLERFCREVRKEGSVDPRAYGVSTSLEEVLERVSRLFAGE